MNPEEEILGFDVDLIKKYPRSNRRLVVDIDEYGIEPDPDLHVKGQTVHISQWMSAKPRFFRIFPTN